MLCKVLDRGSTFLVTGQVVVMDNATFHKGGRIQELIQSAGCRLLYLPPYSPDFNLH
jgi:transposase